MASPRRFPCSTMARLCVLLLFFTLCLTIASSLAASDAKLASGAPASDNETQERSQANTASPSLTLALSPSDNSEAETENAGEHSNSSQQATVAPATESVLMSDSVGSDPLAAKTTSEETTVEALSSEATTSEDPLAGRAFSESLDASVKSDTASGESAEVADSLESQEASHLVGADVLIGKERPTDSEVSSATSSPESSAVSSEPERGEDAVALASPSGEDVGQASGDLGPLAPRVSLPSPLEVQGRNRDKQAVGTSLEAAQREAPVDAGAIRDLHHLRPPAPSRGRAAGDGNGNKPIGGKQSGAAPVPPGSPANQQADTNPANETSTGPGAGAGAANDDSGEQSATEDKSDSCGSSCRRGRSERRHRRGLQILTDIASSTWNAIKAVPTAVLSGARKMRLIARGKLPLSWRRFLSKVPRVDVNAVPEFRRLKEQMRREDRMVMLVETPSKELRALVKSAMRALGLSRVRPGITHATDPSPGDDANAQMLEEPLVVKARVFDERDGTRVGLEVNGQLWAAPKNAFILPAYGAWISDLGDWKPRANEGERRRRKKKLFMAFMVMPRTRGDVRDYLCKRSLPVDVKYAAAEMLYAVQKLHREGFLHRDIKLTNFFVGYDGHVLLADFDGVWPIGVPADADKYLVYTRGYLAPEIDPHDQVILNTAKSDVYALGVCLKQLAKRYPKTADVDKLQDLSDKMTEANPQRRFTLEEALGHSFFDGVDFETLEQLKHPAPFPGDFQNRATFYR
ncbi:rhoptry kinase family protein ROP33 [Toxoplasma gondii RUB]|uniref:Rhoptry kinase family protein ROP33 n=2 Tax=Toxoplasma gondii TaxID=5811 RepID=A0A086LZN2_TOXGO|nr:rhoptry kinase family protein ROP33 [Toxoplasma gondii RUB]KFH06866.1 rhoptry kinase family protein ROP33 [Toxoplasma gondii VAND]